MLPLGKDRKGLPQFHRRICYKRATHVATTRQQLFSMTQQSPTNKVKKFVPCCRRSKHQTLLQGYPCWPVKIFWVKNLQQCSRTGRVIMDNGPLCLGHPWHHLQHHGVVELAAQPWSLAEVKTTQIDIAQVTDLPGRTHLADQSDFDLSGIRKQQVPARYHHLCRPRAHETLQMLLGCIDSSKTTLILQATSY